MKKFLGKISQIPPSAQIEEKAFGLFKSRIFEKYLKTYSFVLNNANLNDLVFNVIKDYVDIKSNGRIYSPIVNSTCPETCL